MRNAVNKATWSLFFLLLLWGSFFFSSVQGLPSPTVRKIYPGNETITISTQEGSFYTHIEGEQPDKDLGTLKVIAKRHASIAGDGLIKKFRPSNNSSYHLVEEYIIKGTVYLHLADNNLHGFHYYIHQDDNIVLEGVVNKTTNINSIALPYGSYLFHALETGYETPAPIPFTLSNSNDPVHIDIAMRTIRSLLKVSSNPPDIAKGKTAILRKASSKSNQQTEIVIGEDPISIETGYYTIEFPNIQGFKRSGGEETFFLGSSQSIEEVTGKYLPNPGSLSIACTTEESFSNELGNLSLQLTKPEGHALQKDLTFNPMTNCQELIIRDLPPGTYLVHFNPPDMIFNTPSPQKVSIESDKTTKLDRYFDLLPGTLEISIQLPNGKKIDQAPFIFIQDSKGTIVETSEGLYFSKDLPPGPYQIAFEEFPGMNTPDPFTVHLKPNKTSGPYYNEYTLATGTLIIDYETGIYGERLKDVQFLVTAEDGSRYTSPQHALNTEYTTDPFPNIKTVIQEIPVGKYTIEFLVPNNDKFFSIPPKQELTIPKRGTATIKESISPNYSSITSYVITNFELHPFITTPTIELHDDAGNIIASASEETLEANFLSPGNYTLFSEPIKDFIAPKPLAVEIGPGESLGPIVSEYLFNGGTLKVFFHTRKDLPRLDTISFTLNDIQSNTIEIPATDRRCILVKDLLSGEYTLKWNIPNEDNLFTIPPPQHLVIYSGELTEIEQFFEPHYGSLEVSTASTKEAKITLQNSEGDIIEYSKGNLLITTLLPGSYLITFGDITNHYTPDPIEITIQAGENLGPFYGEYLPSTGNLFIDYIVETRSELSKQIVFTLTNSRGNSSSFPKDRDLKKSHAGTYQFLIQNLPEDNYLVDISFRDTPELFAPIPTDTITIKGGETENIEHLIALQKGGVHAITKASDGKEISPEIVIKDSSGMTQAYSSDGTLWIDDLILGEYQLIFENIKNYETPASVSFQVLPEEVIGPLTGEYKRNMGQATITYFTDEQQIRLYEIGFWLTDSSGNKIRYPISEQYLEDPNTFGLQMTIEDLLPDTYTLEFDIPNEDNLFAKIPAQQFVVKTNETTTVTQQIAPRYGTVEASFEIPEQHAIITPPSITLKNDRDEIIAIDSGKLLAENLFPGRYILSFEEIDNLSTPSPITIDLLPGDSASPVGYYKLYNGSAEITFQTSDKEEYLSDIQLLITDSQGDYEVFKNTTKDPNSPTRSLKLQNLPAGLYSLKFILPDTKGFLKEVPEQQFSITRNQTTEISQDFPPHYGSLNVSVQLPEGKQLSPSITISDEEDLIVAETTSPQIQLDDLLPGTYVIKFGDIPEYLSSEPVSIEVLADNNYGPIIGTYTLAVGSIKVSFRTDDKEERLDRIRFWLIDKDDNHTMFPKLGCYETDPTTHTRTVTIDDVAVDNYSLQFLLPNTENLFNEIPIHNLKVVNNKITYVTQEITPNYGSLEVTARIPTSPFVTDKSTITLRDPYDNVIAQSSGHLFIDDLIPGSYIVFFEETRNLSAPNPITVKIEPGTLTPVESQYELGKGSAMISYQTGEEGEFLKEIKLIIQDENAKTLEISYDDTNENTHPTKNIVWVDDLPVGKYSLQFILPDTDGILEEVPIQYFWITEEVAEIYQLIEPRYTSSDIHIQWPTAPMIYSNEETVTTNLSLDNLLSGKYTDLSPESYTIESEDIPSTLSNDHSVQDSKSTTTYSRLTTLVVFSNANNYSITIVKLDSLGNPKEEKYEQEINDRSYTFNRLPEGRYRIIFHPLKGTPAMQQVSPPNPKEFVLHAFRPKKIRGIYKSN